MTARAWVQPTAIAAVGAGATASAAVVGRLPAGDAVVLATYAAGAAAISALVAVAVLLGLRRRSIVLQAAIAALAPVVAVAIGVAADASAMLISSHDLHALIVVMVAAGTVGVLSGLLLGRRVATAGRSLGAMARGLGDDEGGEVSGGRDAPSELASVAGELQAAWCGRDAERVLLDELVSEALASAAVSAGVKAIDRRGAVGERAPVVELLFFFSSRRRHTRWGP